MHLHFNKRPSDSGADGSWRALWEALQRQTAIRSGKHIALKSPLRAFLIYLNVFLAEGPGLQYLLCMPRERSLPVCLPLSSLFSIPSEPPGLENSLYRTLHFRYYVLIIISN